VRAGKIKTWPADCSVLSRLGRSGRSQFHDNSGVLAQAPEKAGKINTVLPIAMNRLRLYIPAKFE
jgi:hypothetical protein